MMPVSTVNASNYHLLGNQLKGESHSKRMKRVHATANMNAFSPTLQPLGAMTDYANQFGGPLFMAALVGATIGWTNLSKKKGQDTLKASAVGGAVVAAVLQGFLMQNHQEYDGNDWGQLGILIVGGAVAASLAHGTFRRSKKALT